MKVKQQQQLLNEFDLRFTEMLYHNDFAIRLAKQRELIRILDSFESYLLQNNTLTIATKEKLTGLAKEFFEDAKENDFQSEIYEIQNTIIIKKLSSLLNDIHQ